MLRKMFSNAMISKETALAPNAIAHTALPKAKKIIARMEYLRRIRLGWHSSGNGPSGMGGFGSGNHHPYSCTHNRDVKLLAREGTQIKTPPWAESCDSAPLLSQGRHKIFWGADRHAYVCQLRFDECYLLFVWLLHFRTEKYPILFQLCVYNYRKFISPSAAAGHETIQTWFFGFAFAAAASP